MSQNMLFMYLINCLLVVLLFLVEQSEIARSLDEAPVPCSGLPRVTVK